MKKGIVVKRHVVFIVSEKPVDLSKLDLTSADCVAETLSFKLQENGNWSTAKKVFKYFGGLVQEIQADGELPMQAAVNWLKKVCTSRLFTPAWRPKPGMKKFLVRAADDDPSGSQKVTMRQLEVVAFCEEDVRKVVHLFDNYLEVKDISEGKLIR